MTDLKSVGLKGLVGSNPIVGIYWEIIKTQSSFCLENKYMRSDG